MNKSELKTKLRRCELIAAGTALLATLAILVAYLHTGLLYISAILGYYFGTLSFVVAIERFVALEKAPAWLKLSTIVVSNLKLLFLGLVVYVFYRFGFSVKEMAAGIFVSQLSVLFSVVIVLYQDRKNADVR